MNLDKFIEKALNGHKCKYSTYKTEGGKIYVKDISDEYVLFAEKEDNDIVVIRNSSYVRSRWSRKAKFVESIARLNKYPIDERDIERLKEILVEKSSSLTIDEVLDSWLSNAIREYYIESQRRIERAKAVAIIRKAYDMLSKEVQSEIRNALTLSK